jgi:Ser/Thr protein kinase RdoA (MazF antagonist)
MDAYLERAGFSGSLRTLATAVADAFNLETVVASSIMRIGYEDCNFSLLTTKGKYFVKVFSTVRTPADCTRIVDVMAQAQERGVSIPSMHASSQGYLHLLKLAGKQYRLCVIDFIPAKDLYSGHIQLTKNDIRELGRQASFINSLPLKPKPIYDSWAIVHFPEEFKKKKMFMPPDDLRLLTPLVEEYARLDIPSLPRAFVHGDIISINVLKDGKKLWIVDFSVANYYPRIQELAVMACDVLFDKTSKAKSEENLRMALDAYQQTLPLTPRELSALPGYIRLAHGMHLLNSTYELRVNKNTTKLNAYFLALGRAGLKQMS